MLVVQHLINVARLGQVVAHIIFHPSLGVCESDLVDIATSHIIMNNVPVYLHLLQFPLLLQLLVQVVLLIYPLQEPLFY